MKKHAVKPPVVEPALPKPLFKPMIDELDARRVEQLPEPQPQSAELDQDPGGGYNPDGTYPQT